jgi:hypothetical protein
MTSTLASASTRRSRTVVYAAAGISTAVLFALTGWTTESLLAGAAPLEALLTAVTGFVFFGWITVLVLASFGGLGAWLLGAAATQRRWSRSRTAMAGAAGWLAVTALPAALGAQLLPASGFGLPAVVPAATLAGLLAGWLVGGPHGSLRDAD